MDHALHAASRTAAATITAYADVLGPDAIREKSHLQPALKYALVDELGAAVVQTERRLEFAHWNGLSPRRVGGIDLLVGDDGHWLAFIELKWCPLDGIFLGWVIWDFFKMATGRISPGADATYVIAGAPDALWAREGTVGEVFATREWDMRELFARHEVVFRGDSTDCWKLTALPHELNTTLVVDQPLTRKLAGWTIKGVRVEVAPESTAWLRLREGYLADPVLT